MSVDVSVFTVATRNRNPASHIGLWYPARVVQGNEALVATGLAAPQPFKMLDGIAKLLVPADWDKLKWQEASSSRGRDGREALSREDGGPAEGLGC